MRERPILFSAPLVRAILSGTKTQTRRVVKPQPSPELLADYAEIRARYGSARTDAQMLSDCVPCPYGQPGDRLWVRETWRPRVSHSCAMVECDCDDINVRYAADGECGRFMAEHGAIPDDWTMPKAADRGNVSPLFMPRWASRILLEVTDVRVERLQDISDHDALAEGIDGWVRDERCETERDGFRVLWESINGAGSWDANPWVWAIAFRRLEAGHG